MYRYSMVLILGFLVHVSVANTLELGTFFSKSKAFFEQNVSMGKVNYKGIAAKPEMLNELVNQIANADLASASDEEQLAFYINAYNLLVIQQVVSQYPIEGPMKVKGFFDTFKHDVAGKQLSLNELEKGVIFKKFNDPRLHLVLVCAAKGCPPLMETAFLPQGIERQIEKAAIIALNDSYFTRVDHSKKRVGLSKIFEWYQGDFKNKKGMMAFINHYRKDKIPDKYKVSYYEYDWSLNE